jgi:hypothetical protein
MSQAIGETLFLSSFFLDTSCLKLKGSISQFNKVQAALATDGIAECKLQALFVVNSPILPI